MWIGRFPQTSDHRPRRRFFHICRQSLFAAKNARPPTRSTRGTSASGASGRSRWRTPPRDGPIPPRCGAGSRPGRTRCGATATSCRCSRAPEGTLPAGWTPLLRADRLAERARPRARCGSRTTPPTRPTRSRTASSSVALARARELGFQTVACASTGNLANAVAAHAAAAGLESYVFIPLDLEEQKVLATGVYGTNLVAVRGNYDDVNRLCTELSGEHEWAFVNINMRPYYAEGSKTLAFETCRAARVRAARPGRLPDRVGLAVHEDRARLRGVARARALIDGRAADVQRRPGGGLLAGRDRVRGGPGLLPPGQAGHDRQVAGDRQPRRRAVRARPRPAHRRARSTRSPTTRSARGSGCWRGRPGSSPRPPAASPSRCSRSWPSAATSTLASGSSHTSPARV